MIVSFYKIKKQEGHSMNAKFYVPTGVYDQTELRGPLSHYLGVFTKPKWCTILAEEKEAYKQNPVIFEFQGKNKKISKEIGEVTLKGKNGINSIKHYGYLDGREYPDGIDKYVKFLKGLVNDLGKNEADKIINERKLLRIQEVVNLASNDHDPVFIVSSLEESYVGLTKISFRMINFIFDEKSVAIHHALKLEGNKVKVHSIERNCIFSDLWKRASLIFDKDLNEERPDYKNNPAAINKALDEFFPIPQ